MTRAWGRADSVPARRAEMTAPGEHQFLEGGSEADDHGEDLAGTRRRSRGARAGLHLLLLLVLSLLVVRQRRVTRSCSATRAFHRSPRRCGLLATREYVPPPACVGLIALAAVGADAFRCHLRGSALRRPRLPCGRDQPLPAAPRCFVQPACC